ncbi:hypothetical protein ACN27B_08830 [Micromonospora sp. WMMD754]|uniref:hypothetical protein n=1 Tax=Micromonospora sp. WMMD754 TaxID=3404114 RepID=UPI003BF5C41D
MDFKADIYERGTHRGVWRFTAADDTEAVELARQHALSVGADSVLVWRCDDLGRCDLIDSVEVDR